MKFALIQNGTPHVLRDKTADEIVKVFLKHGHQLSEATNGIRFALNLTDAEKPRIFRRNSQAVFVVSLIELEKPAANLKSFCYTTLVRSLSNLLLCVVPPEFSTNSSAATTQVYFTTPEAGFYHCSLNSETVYQRILPIVSAHFAIGNQLDTDLPPAYWQGSPVVEQIKQYGRKLDHLGVLPAPFPLREVLSEEDIGHLYTLFQVKGLSYGNLSARELIPELGESTFWMTARGVNKAAIVGPGKDLLLVKGADTKTGNILVSVPPKHDPRVRVSVDAIEHLRVYQTYPRVGAIVHVHAWMDGVLCSKQNHPCGTVELADEVVQLLGQTPDPANAAVGLKNHGLTITGESLPEIFQRIRGKLKTEVPMFV